MEIVPFVNSAPAGVPDIRPADVTAGPAPGAAADLLSLQEKTAQHLEDTGLYRILRRIPPRSSTTLEDARANRMRIGVVVDVETTGLDRGTDEVTEFGAVLFEFDDEGKVGGIIDTLSEFRQPSGALDPAITRLTGITDEMLEGRSIDPDKLARFIDPAELVVAHNAAFDRHFCERLSPIFRSRPWACSLRGVDWGETGRGGLRLGQLLATMGHFHCGHRALDDCVATLEILAMAGRQPSPMAELLRSVVEPPYEIRAERAPFEARLVLKSRGYRWNDGSDGRPKAWVVEVPSDRRDQEIEFLRREIYRPGEGPVWRRLEATDRFR